MATELAYEERIVNVDAGKLFTHEGKLVERVRVRGIGTLLLGVGEDGKTYTACREDHPHAVVATLRCWLEGVPPRWEIEQGFGGTEYCRISDVLEAWSSAKAVEGGPRVGMGATILGYTDRKAATVIDVSPSGKRIVVQLDKAVLLNPAGSSEPDALRFEPGGFVGHTSGRQRWRCTADPGGTKLAFTLRRNGRWIQEGESMRQGTRLHLGVRDHHYDFNF